MSGHIFVPENYLLYGPQQTDDILWLSKIKKTHPHNHAAPLTPDESPCLARRNGVVTSSENTHRPHSLGMLT